MVIEIPTPKLFIKKKRMMLINKKRMVRTGERETG
jgi:hypothetical protein